MDNKESEEIAYQDPAIISGALVTSINSSIKIAAIFGVVTAIVLAVEVFRWGINDLYAFFIIGFLVFSFGTYKKNKLSAIMLFLFGALLLLAKYAYGTLTPLTTLVSIVALYYFLQGAIGVFRANKSF